MFFVLYLNSEYEYYDVVQICKYDLTSCADQRTDFIMWFYVLLVAFVMIIFHCSDLSVIWISFCISILNMYIRTCDLAASSDQVTFFNGWFYGFSFSKL